MSGPAEVATDDYPMTTCPVTGAELGTMGPPVGVMLGDRVIRVCCAGCVDTVKADSEKYLRILNEAAATQNGEYGHGMHHEGGY